MQNKNHISLIICLCLNHLHLCHMLEKLYSGDHKKIQDHTIGIGAN